MITAAATLACAVAAPAGIWIMRIPIRGDSDYDEFRRHQIR